MIAALSIERNHREVLITVPHFQGSRIARRVKYCGLFLLALFPSVQGQPQDSVVPQIDFPVRVEKISASHWFIDFGRAAFGNIEITAPPDVAETNVTVSMGEKTASGGTLDRSPGGSVRYQRHSLSLLPGGSSSPELLWQPPDWMTSGWVTRPEAIAEEVMPFRYVEIEQAPNWFSSSCIHRISWSVPFDEEASHFGSSRPELNAVWNLCKYSIKATSFLGLYVDGDRERRPYEADVLINQLGHYCVDSHYETARLSQEYLLQHPTWPTEWRLQSVMIAWNDFLWSGDDDLLRRHYSTLKSRAMIGRRTGDALFRSYQSRDCPPGIEDIVDWPQVERDGYDMNVEVKTVVTAFHYRVLVLLAKIAAHLGESDEAEQFAELAHATYLAVNNQLWSESRGCYLDGLNPTTGELSRHAAAHANFIPLALGLVPRERVGRIADFLKSRGMPCSVYGAQFLLEALYSAGEAEHALELLCSTELRSWLNMRDTVGSTITLEAWDPSVKPNLDWNHAWGAAPANIIPRCLMGIEPLEPGFKRFRVHPQIAGLPHAVVRTPTPRGPVSLEIDQPSGPIWRAEISVPSGTVAEFHLPPYEPESLNLSPGSASASHKELAEGVLELFPGHHFISLRKR